MTHETFLESICKITRRILHRDTSDEMEIKNECKSVKRKDLLKYNN